MNTQKIKIVGLFLFVCTVLLLGLVACKVEPAATDTETKWTVTIDPRGLSLGGTLTISVSDGETATLPSDYSIPTDYEIPYYSTVKDDPSVPFEFGTTKVTSDITVYPHFRYQEDKIVKNISGAWLNPMEIQSVPNGFVYKVSSDSALNVYCSAIVVGQVFNLNLADSVNREVVSDLSKLTNFTSGQYTTPKNFTNVGDVIFLCKSASVLNLTYKSKISDELSLASTKFFNLSGASPYSLIINDANSITLIDSTTTKTLLKKVN